MNGEEDSIGETCVPSCARHVLYYVTFCSVDTKGFETNERYAVLLRAHEK
jgi:hypothetical protein